jgi:hypothetical protein
LLVDPSYQLKTTYFLFVSTSFVNRGRLLWRDVGCVLVESKSLSVFIQMGWGYFQPSQLSYNFKKDYRTSEHIQYIATEGATTRHVFDMKLKENTECMLLIAVMYQVRALRNYSRLIT